MSVAFFPLKFIQTKEKLDYLSKVQDEISSVRARIKNKCRQSPHPDYWFMINIEGLASKMRSRFVLHRGEIEGIKYKSSYASNKAKD